VTLRHLSGTITGEKRLPIVSFMDNAPVSTSRIAAIDVINFEIEAIGTSVKGDVPSELAVITALPPLIKTA
jgi:hypothetical protein